MKSTKFQPGTFIELDDLDGGRKVALVGKDGVTFWDSVHTDQVTPLLIHPVLKPVALGSLVAFARAHRLGDAARHLLAALRGDMDPRQNDALFVMRALWQLAPGVAGDGWVPDDAALRGALQAAQAQEQRALRVHEQAGRYVAMM